MTIDSFFFFKEQPVNTATVDDIAQGFVEDPRRLYYGSELSAGIAAYENYPISFFQEIVIRYAASDYIGRRNFWVADGTEDLPDRRAVSSQSVVEVERGSLVELGEIGFHTTVFEPDCRSRPDRVRAQPPLGHEPHDPGVHLIERLAPPLPAVTKPHVVNRRHVVLVRQREVPDVDGVRDRLQRFAVIDIVRDSRPERMADQSPTCVKIQVITISRIVGHIFNGPG